MVLAEGSKIIKEDPGVGPWTILAGRRLDASVGFTLTEAEGLSMT